MADSPEVLASVDLMLTRKCNLRCAFCYIRERTSVNAEGEVDRNIKVCNLLIEQFVANRPEHNTLQLNLYGGEPTTAWESVKAINEWRKSSATRGVRVQMGLVTNMVLMDEAKLDYCIAERIGIHPSVDGCEEVEDMFRVTETGAKVSHLVFANAKRLVQKLPHRSCRATICPESARFMFKSIKFLTEEIGFHTVNQVCAGGADWTPEAIHTVKDQTTLITDWWIDNMRKGIYWDLYYLRNMFTGIWNPVRTRRLCGAGCGRACVDTDGTLTPCHRFANETTRPEYKMGNIFDGGLNKTEFVKSLRDFDVAAYHKERCATCVAVNSCHALCIHESMEAGNGPFDPLPHYCQIWPHYWHEAMRAHSIMMAENNATYLDKVKPKPRQPRQQSRPTPLVTGGPVGKI